jgi:hypothetical protein
VAPRWMLGVVGVWAAKGRGLVAWSVPGPLVLAAAAKQVLRWLVHKATALAGVHVVAIVLVTSVACVDWSLVPRARDERLTRDHGWVLVRGTRVLG